MEDLTCKISSILFENRSANFYIFKAKSDEGGIVTVRGSFPGSTISVGIKAKFTGKWENHSTYGKQFNAHSCDVIIEKNRSGIVTYLSSHVPSIGPITAAKLYDAFGDELISVLESDHDRIRSLKFLTRIQSEQIIKEWSQASQVRNMSVFLTDLGLTASQIKHVYDRFGTSTIDNVKQDPYCLYQVSGIGFATADVAARKLGVGVDDERRIKSLLLYAINELSQSEGHMYVITDQIKNSISKLFNRHVIEPFSHGDYLSDSHYYQALTSLLREEKIVSIKDKIYPSKNWIHESTSAECMSKIISQSPWPFSDLENTLAEFEKEYDIALSDEQRQAFLNLKKSRACVISGYPGTGKTLLVSAFVYLFEKYNIQFSLLSPTGIAAKRLSQVTGKTASTIHRALGYKRDGTWEFHQHNKFIVDAVLVDEMSMVDGATFYHLISSLSPTTIFIAVGDSAQLPSVGAGYVLNNLMHCSEMPHITLTRIYRQSKQSDIVNVAHSILQGQHIDTSFNKESEFVFVESEHQNIMKEVCRIAEAMKRKNESSVAVAHQSFQIIAPTYKGDVGVNNLNIELRKVLNQEHISGKAARLKHGEADIYEGDRVMTTKNDYERMVFNGDVGKVQRINLKSDEVEVKIFNWFDHESSVPRYVDKIFVYKVEEARQVLNVAYACTVHRCQGQEYDYVIIPMTMQFGFMLYKNLIYTAITRAKKKVFLIGDPKSFTYAVNNVRETIRNSSLKNLIGDYVNNIDPQAV